MQAYKPAAKAIPRLSSTPCRESRYVALTRIAQIGELSLSKTSLPEVSNDCFPLVHVARLSLLRCFRNSQSDQFLNHYCDMSTYGERLFEARKEAKLTQGQLAEKSGVSQTTISDGERGRNAGSGSIAALAASLGVEPMWLSDGKGPKRRDSSAHEKQEICPERDPLLVALDVIEAADKIAARHYRSQIIAAADKILFEKQQPKAELRKPLPPKNQLSG